MNSSLTINQNCNLENKGNDEEAAALVTTRLNELASSVKFEPWIDPAHVIPLNPGYVPPVANRDDNTYFSDESSLQKLNPGSSALKELFLDEGEDLCEGVNIDDVTLNFDTGYNLFGCSQTQPRYNCDDANLDCLVMEKNLSVTESNSHVENALEATSSQDCMGFQSSQVTGPASSVMQAMSNTNCMILNQSCSRNIGVGFAPPGPVGSNLSRSLRSVQTSLEKVALLIIKIVVCLQFF
jgi:hypothetical protein